MTGQQISNFVSANFDVVKDRSSGDELVFICPTEGCPDKSGNRSVNLKTGLTSCFRCNSGGHFINWVRRLGYEIEDDGSDGTAVAISELDDAFKEESSRLFLPTVTDLPYPTGFDFLANRMDSKLAGVVEQMAISRNLTMDDMLRADVGWTVRDPVWSGYAIFPIVDYNRVPIYQGRALSKATSPSKRFPSREVCKYGARYWVYNIDKVRAIKPNVVIATESILNVLSMENKLAEEGIDDTVPICVFKHKISREQVEKLRRAFAGIKEVCFAFDADATTAAKKQALELSNIFNTTTHMSIDPLPDNPTRDINDDADHAFEKFLQRERATLLSSMIEF